MAERLLCVIPARYASKRLPHKNVREVAGRPMIAYTIEAARASGLFDEVIVSTEHPVVAAVARTEGAVVHARPQHLAGDEVSATDVCLEVLDAREKRGESYEAIVCLQPSSPLRTAEDILTACETLRSTKCDLVVSATEIDPHYFHWAVHPSGDDYALYFGPSMLKERMHLPKVYRPNGAIKIGRVASLRALRHFFGPRLQVSFMPEERSVHVATAVDLALAEVLLTERRRLVHAPL